MRKHLQCAPGSTPVRAAKTAYLLCPHNGCIIEDDAQGSVMAAMNAGGFLIGDTDNDDVWLDLANLMLNPVQGLHIEKGFIDSSFRPDKPEAGSVHKVYDFCRRHSYIATPCKGRSTLGGAPHTVSKIEVKPDRKRRPFSMKLVMLDTDFVKCLVHSRIKTPIEAPGAFHLHRELDEDFARQLHFVVRLVEPGKSKPVWKQVKRVNHCLDCAALAAAAGYAMNVQRIPEGVERDETAASQTDTTRECKDSPAPAASAKDKDAARRALQSMVAGLARGRTGDVFCRLAAPTSRFVSANEHRLMLLSGRMWRAPA